MQYDIHNMQDGIYFDMPDEVYHSIPRLSASGIKNLLKSGMDFWAWSWMNPRKPESESEALAIGKAYHTRILEGRDKFYFTHAPAFDHSTLDADMILDTINDMKDVLEPNGIRLKSTARKDDYKQAIKDLNMGYIFVDEEREHYESLHVGKIFLSPTLIEQIEISALMIERHPQLSKAIMGGYPEVTILWTCKKSGVKMKARLDYLKIQAITDLKTFTNNLNKTIDRAISHAMASHKYHIQSGVYYEAVDYGRDFARQGAVYGNVDPAWLEQFGQEQDTQFVFIFQQKGIAPVTRGKIMPKMSVHDLSVVAIDEAKESYNRYVETFGTDPWLDETPIEEFQDTEFPNWISDL